VNGRTVVSGEAGLRTATPPPPVALHLFSLWFLGGLTAPSRVAAKANVNL
jgi:hypothetical protein